VLVVSSQEFEFRSLTLGFNLGNTHEELGIVLEDGSTASVGFLVKTWWSHHWTNKGAIRAPYQYNPDGEPVYNASHIFHTTLAMPAETQGKRVAGFLLPKPREHNTLHVFAISCEATTTDTEDRAVPVFVKASRRWADLDADEATAAGAERGQIVQVAVRNPLSAARYQDLSTWVDHPIEVTLAGANFKTVRAGYIPRLMPGDEVRVDVVVVPTVKAESFGNAKLNLSGDNFASSRPVTVEGAALVHDFTKWTADNDDVEQHTAPGWYEAAKFGIFIHWGVFSVPAWAPVPRYAEWYDFWIHDDKPGMAAYEHHLKTYGPDFVYDDFIPMFTADKFNASEWVELFSDAGAKYFVFTTKHHDGYALFDTKETSNRNSLLLGPKRDFLRELMDAAEKEQPHLRRGTYFSMPEWFNPLYKKHGRVSFPGGPAYNPYKPGEVEPYHGFVNVSDYIDDLQLPQMRILADDYKTELVWCDIGLDNASAEFVSEWYAQAARVGREVSISNRCGIGGDFDTPELEKYDSVELNKWETCTSMDPFSFGYSADTKPDEYRNATNVVHTLVDITAKGGNFLLNVGPRADGVIIDAIAKPLREAGKWLKVNGRAIYETVPFPLIPEIVNGDHVHVQLTRTPKSLFLISLKDLSGRIFALESPLPVLPCDEIVFVTEDGDIDVSWTYEEGVLRINISGVDEADYTGRIAYVFEIKYRQCQK
jgi:alpha-L-fucosidase